MSSVTLRWGFLYIVWPLVLSFNDHHVDKTKQQEEKEEDEEENVKPGLALSGFQTTQQVNLT